MNKWRDLLEEGQTLFKKKQPFDSLCQEIAENFYPERANFTSTHTMGEEFANHLYSSYPLLARRELGDSFSTLSRPQGEEWFHMALEDEDREDHDAKIWMEHKTKIQRRVMYNPNSRFVRSMKEGDHDWATFGQCALSAELNRNRDGLLYRNWHLRDMAWTESFSGKVDCFWRKWKPTNRQIIQYFGEESVHKDCKDEKEKQKEVNCMHIFVPGEYCGYPSPFVSFYIDVDHQHLIEQKPMAYGYYVVPRWVTVSDSQYAYSPAVIAGLPDARLFQDITRVILEAGQKAVDPPLIATEDQIKSSIDIQAGGLTMVSAEYDERLGEVLRPLNLDKSGLPLGIEITDRVQLMLAKAFYLDKLNLPRGQEMTAYETSIRFQEYVRTILPVFEPKEVEMEGAVCDLTFDILFRHGAFGSVREIPRSMQGASYQFKFVSPLSKALEEKNTNAFMTVKGVIAEAAQIDPSVVTNININKAARAAVKGAGAPQEWLNSEEDVEAAQQQRQQMMQAQQQLGVAQQAKELMSGS